MELAGEEFVITIFSTGTLRHPTEIEVENFRNLIKTGAANPVLAYIILSSDEIPGELEKVNIDIYRKSYKQYLVKRKLRNNKFFSVDTCVFCYADKDKVLHRAFPMKEK